MLALSIRQPYAELILRGIKTIEYRSRPTTIVGERFWIYAAKAKVKGSLLSVKAPPARVWSSDLELPRDTPPWMLELAEALRIFPEDLPRGVIVGSAIIDRVTPGQGVTEGLYHWHLADVQRAKRPRSPKGQPQPVWWRPTIG